MDLSSLSRARTEQEQSTHLTCGVYLGLQGAIFIISVIRWTISHQSGGRQLNSWCRLWTVQCLCGGQLAINEIMFICVVEVTLLCWIFYMILLYFTISWRSWKIISLKLTTKSLPQHWCSKWQVLVILNRTPTWVDLIIITMVMVTTVKIMI